MQQQSRSLTSPFDPSPPDSCIVEPANYHHMMELVDRLLASHGAARNYLAEKSRCSPAGLQNEAVLIPLVVKQETESLKCAVEVLLELYRLAKNSFITLDRDLLKKAKFFLIT